MHTPMAARHTEVQYSVSCDINGYREQRSPCSGAGEIHRVYLCHFFFFQAEDGIRDLIVTGVQTCALPIFPVQLRVRQMKNDRVRLSMLTRTLLCAPDAESIHVIQLSALLHVSWPLLRAPIRDRKSVV